MTHRTTGTGPHDTEGEGPEGSSPGPSPELPDGAPIGPHGLSFELPERGTGVRAARRAARQATAGAGRSPSGTEGRPRQPARPSRRWNLAFAASLIGCLVLAVGLLAVGVTTLRDSRAGRTVTTAAPDEPGFEAFLEPTPTLGVFVEHDGSLVSAAVLALGAEDRGGGILLVPADTLVGEGTYGSLATGWAFGGPDPENRRGSLEIVAGVGVPEAVVLDDAHLADLVAPVAPIRIDNPDDLEGFPIGPVDLAPEQVGPYLRAQRDDESDLARLARQQLVWGAWLSAVAGGGPAAVPGELDTGLGRFVRGLAGGPHEIRTLPVEEERTEGGIVYTVRKEERSQLVVQLVPYPTGTELAPRTLVRLLDGAGQPGHVAAVAPSVVAADASIVVVGNADRFDYSTTQIRYHQPGQRAAALRLRDSIGAGEVVEDVRPIDSFDATIILGSDV